MASSNPFPLPLRSEEVKVSPGTPRHLARRLSRHIISEKVLEKAVTAVNALSGAVGCRGMLDSGTAPNRGKRIPSIQFTACQESMVANMGRCCNQFLPVLPRADVGGLREVLRAKSIYDLGDDTTVAAYDADRLNVLRGGTRRLPACDLVGKEARDYLDDPDRLLVLPPGELAVVEDPIQPHWDPALAKPGGDAT